MKKNRKPIRKPAAGRDLFSELTEGIIALAEARQGRRILPTHTIETITSNDRD